MSSQTLDGCAILVVEDEYVLADDLRRELTEVAATVIGPAGTVAQGWAFLRDAARIDGAILDVNLRGKEVFAFANELLTRDVPFVFMTGYDASVIPDRFGHVVRCEKPVQMGKVVAALGRVTSG